MISFRFHLVSLTAVFLALALGIVLGTTVVERATVSVLEGRIKSVRASAAAARVERDDLRSDAAVTDRFGTEVEAQIITGRLSGLRILVVTANGVDSAVVDALRADLTTAGAVDVGAVSFEATWSKDLPKTRATVATALGLPGTPTLAALRDETAARLSQEWAIGSGPTIAALVDAGLAHVSGADIKALPGPDAQIVMIGNAPVNGLEEPLARALGVTAENRVVVSEVGPAKGADAVLVGALRRQRGPAQLSTVDHAETLRGRVAIVLSLAALTRGETGDYGSAGGADRTVPPPA